MTDLAENRLARRVYFASPVFIQNALLSLKGFQLHKLRYREPLHSQLVKELDKSQWLSAKDLKELSYRRLRQQIVWAYDQTDYYRGLFDRIGFQPSSDWDLEDFRQIPLLTRADIRKQGRAMVARSISRRELLPRHTSGTTSSPLLLVGHRDETVANWAHWTRFRGWCGFSVSEPRVSFNGRIFLRPSQDRPPFWRYNAAEQQLLVSSFHVSETSAASIVKRINDFKPVHIDGYVSSLFTMAKFIHESGARIHSPRAMSTYSETMFPYQREMIEKAFGCRVHNQYGAGEAISWAAECPEGGFHIDEEYGLTEVIKPDGTPAGPGEKGEIVATGYYCRAMPLIRYATSDLAIFKEGSCRCGRGSRLLAAVEGRVLDVIVTPSGRHIPPTALTLLFDKAEVLNIRESQIVQTAVDQIVVRVVPHTSFSSQHEMGIISDLKRILGQEMEIRVQVVEKIPLTRTGKFRFVVREGPAAQLG